MAVHTWTTPSHSHRSPMPSTANPKISVVMSVYNSENYLVQALNSILTQSCQDFEFIIVNDGSTDGSLEILRRYAERDQRIRLISRGNTGVTAAVNEALTCARGEFIARMDSDDISLPTRLEVQLAYMKEHPACVALGCRWLTIDPDGCPIRSWNPPLSHEEIDSLHLKGVGGGIAGPALLLRREAVEAVGRYRVEYPLAEDYDLLLRLAEVGRLANLPDVLFYYREHATSLMRTRRAELRMLTWKALKEAHERRHLSFDRPPPPPPGPMATNLPLRWSRYALQAEYFSTARKHAWRQFLEAPAIGPLRVLVEATVRPVSEPFLWIYDLIRLRKPRRRRRGSDPRLTEVRVRHSLRELARPIGNER
jgi:GT2 family glycosyltransferase